MKICSTLEVIIEMKAIVITFLTVWFLLKEQEIMNIDKYMEKKESFYTVNQSINYVKNYSLAVFST